jgi:GT2 family glycosyltransferase
MNTKPNIFVIILNYNGLSYLKGCLSSWVNQTYPYFSLVVCDNASTDKTEEFVKSNFPNVILIRNEKNIGFARANNLAISFALAHGADFVLLLNNDTIVYRDLLERLTDELESDDSIGIVGPMIVDIEGKYIQEVGMRCDKFGYPLPGRLDDLNNRPIFFVSGCALMIKKEVLTSVGLFDDDFFMFAEDLDFCWRAQLVGYKVEVSDKAMVRHVGGGSIFGGVVVSSRPYATNLDRILLRERNTLRTLIKNFGNFSLFSTVPMYIGLIFIEGFMWLLMQKPYVSLCLIKAVLWNLKVLPDTLTRRRQIQKLRIVDDAFIRERLVKGFGKLQVFSTSGVPKVKVYG